MVYSPKVLNNIFFFCFKFKGRNSNKLNRLVKVNIDLNTKDETTHNTKNNQLEHILLVDTVNKSSSLQTPERQVPLMSSNEELAQISKTKRANQQNLSANRDSPISKKSFDLLIDHKNNNTENDSNGSSNEFKETNVDDQCIINTSKNSSR